MSASNRYVDAKTGEKIKVRYNDVVNFVKEHPNGNVEFDFNGQAIIAKQGSLSNMLRRGLISKL